MLSVLTEPTIRKYCPDLSKRVSARFRRHWMEDDEHRMKQELENALKGDKPISLSAVAQRLGCDTSALRKRFPDLCRAVVTRYRERIDYEQIQRRLQEVLESETEAISVNELAQEMGYKRHVLWDNFPDLCNQITERRSTTRRKHHEERVAAFCNEIREAVLFLHNQGIYPNAELVSKQLNDPHAIRIMEGHEAWRMALEELGYETGHLKKYFFLQ